MVFAVTTLNVSRKVRRLAFFRSSADWINGTRMIYGFQRSKMVIYMTRAQAMVTETGKMVSGSALQVSKSMIMNLWTLD